MVNCAAVYCHNNKRKNKDKFFFSLLKDTAVAKNCQTLPIAKLNREKDNLPSKVYLCSDHFEDDCFDSSWILQSTLTYLDRSVQNTNLLRQICSKTPSPRSNSHEIST